MIHTDTILTFSLLTSPLEEIIEAATQAWIREVLQVRLLRPEWQFLPTLDIHATRNLMKAADLNGEQKAYAVHLTGASMQGTKTKHFLDTEGKCSLCGHLDTQRHRVMECPATSALRAQYNDLHEALQEQHTCHVDLPAVYAPDHTPFMQWYMQHRPAPDFIPEPQQPVYYYTDGSCSHPQSFHFRRAAFSVISCQSVTEAQQKAAISRYQRTGDLPEQFRVQAVGEVRGRQTISRAELQAVAWIIQHVPRACIYTDSQYVCNIVALLRRTLDIRTLHKRKNFDILLQMHAHLTDNHMIYKIKSHAIDIQCDSLYDTWHKLGNEAADKAAKQALHNWMARFPLWDSTKEFDDHVLQRKTYISYLKELHVLRKALLLPDQPVRMNVEHVPWHEQIDILKHWPPVEEPLQHFDFSPPTAAQQSAFLWGTGYTMELLEWLQMLRWPQKPDPLGAGVAWIELLLSFKLFTQTGVVVNTGRGLSDFQPRRTDYNELDLDVGQQIHAFTSAIQNIEGILQRKLLPTDKKLAQSLRIMGNTNAKSGFMHRPAFPHQALITDLLVTRFAAMRTDAQVYGIPELPFLERQSHQTEHAQDQEHWTDRIQRYRRYLHLRRRTSVPPPEEAES
eukprot:Skav219371  [mRNA]  locus=scaffold76:638676:640538:- [translate_table: standard]